MRRKAAAACPCSSTNDLKELTMSDCDSLRKRKEGFVKPSGDAPPVSYRALSQPQTDRATAYSGDSGERPARRIAEDAGNVRGKEGHTAFLYGAPARLDRQPLHWDRGDSPERRARYLTMRDCDSPRKSQSGIIKPDGGRADGSRRAAHTPRPTGELSAAVTRRRDGDLDLRRRKAWTRR